MSLELSIDQKSAVDRQAVFRLHPDALEMGQRGDGEADEGGHVQGKEPRVMEVSWQCGALQSRQR